MIDSGRRPVVNWVYVDDIGMTVERMFRRASGRVGGFEQNIPLRVAVDGAGARVDLGCLVEAGRLNNGVPKVRTDRVGLQCDALHRL